MRLLLMIFAIFMVTACGTVDTPTERAGQPTQPVSIRITTQPTVVTASETEVHFSKDRTTLVLNKPTQWETFPTEYGVVIGEHIASVETAGILEGLMAYAFVTPLSELSVNIKQAKYPAHAVLVAMLSAPVHSRNTRRSEVVPFEWDGYDAAYYLVSDVDGTATFVVGVIVPEQGILLSYSVKAPYEQRERIGEMLPTLLDALRLNDVHFSGQPFETFAEDLQFPKLPSPDRSF